MCRQIQRDTTRTTNTAIATAMPAFAPIERPPPGIGGGGGGEVDDGADIMAVGGREERRCRVVEPEAKRLILSACAGCAIGDAGRITGVRVRVVVMSVLAMRVLAQQTIELKTKTKTTVRGQTESRRSVEKRLRSATNKTLKCSSGAGAGAGGGAGAREGEGEGEEETHAVLARDWSLGSTEQGYLRFLTLTSSRRWPIIHCRPRPRAESSMVGGLIIVGLGSGQKGAHGAQRRRAAREWRIWR
jgi:hypothetical protein